jgi:lysophospholipase L1-like esterase
MSKKIIFSAIALSILAVSFFFVFGERERPIANYPPREGLIIAFGDSLIAGTGAAPEKDFVSVLSVMIGKPIQNMGNPGDTTEAGLMRLDEVIQKHPSIVLVLLGGNDYLRRVPKEKTFKNLDAIVSRLESDGALVVLLGVRGGLLSDGFDDEFESLAKRKSAAHVPDVLDGIFGNPPLMSDEIHPNSEGYALIAQKIYPILSALLK